MIPIKPNNVFWSDEQWQAIHEGGKNILVSAGAGSGKTAVLTQRIIEILKKGICLDKLIVLTFTKAAARQMKERLRGELSKVKGNQHFQKQLNYLDQAAIQTFDAFALSLVKRYHYLLGVNKSINIGDNVLLSIKRKKIINDIFNCLYESKNQDFLDFVTTFALKKDDSLQNCLYNIWIKTDLLANTNEYLAKYLDKFYSLDYIDEKIDEFSRLIKFDLDRIKIRLDNIKNIVTDEKLVKYYEDLQNSLTDLLAARTYMGYLENINVSYPRLASKDIDEDEKNRVLYEREQIKKLVSKIKDYLIYDNIEEIKQELFQTKRFSKVIIDIILEANKRYDEYKKQVNLYEFLDIAKLAIRIFEENEDIRAFYKNNIYEILIDEYQDTSDIQERLINEIANNNVYMVGDIKQSIYKFRNANPDIFKNKYEMYKNEEQGIVIDLSKNFRSRKEVLNNINDIFSKIMTLDLGGVDYNDNHALVFGNLEYESKQNICNYDLDILTYSYTDDALTTTEKEAFIVAYDILDKLKEKYQIFDKDLGRSRNCKYSDFTILVSEKGRFEIFKKIFEYLQLPLVIHKEEDFIRSNEMYVIKNILRVVYCLIDKNYFKENFKDAIYSVLRSFLVEASDEEISLIFTGNIIQGLNLRFNEVYNNLYNVARMVEKSTLREILGEIYKVFDVYYNIVKLGNVEETENKLNFLLDRFDELDSSGYNLLDAILYLEVLINEGYDIETSEVTKIDDSAVNIMSIHKSKGLEFPVCYYVELGSRFKMTESSDRIYFDKDYGFIFPVFKEGLKDTIYNYLVKYKGMIEEISERLRVFYVALTRSKEKIIIVSEKFTEVVGFYDGILPLVDRLNYNSFYSILNSLRSILLPYNKLVTVNGTKDYVVSRKVDLIPQNTSKIDIRNVNVVMKKEEKVIASASGFKLLTKEKLESMEFGSLIHQYFELIDINKDIKKQLENLEISDKIKEKIIRFYDIDIFKENILNIYHEYQFSYYEDNILNRGIIDLILEFEAKIIIIDFKLSDLLKTEYTKQLQVYYDYLKRITNKKIEAYLYSIIKEELRLIIGGE